MLTELQRHLRNVYTIDRELIGGGMSRVFLAHDVKLGRPVVIKLLPPDQSAALSVERFRREIQIAAALRHPHIVPLLDAGEVGGTLYYTMPYIEGESVQDRLHRDGTIPLPDAVRLCAEVADALEYAHARGIVHRDIKPANILLDSGHAVVTDFGIARAISESNAAPLTTGGIGIGTPGYMSPEQAYGEPVIDGRSDIYSLGCVLYEMVTGGAPASARAEISVAAGHSSRFGSLLPILARALASNRADRFATASAFRDALTARRAEGHRHRARLVVAIMLLVAGSAATLVWHRAALANRAPSWERRQLSAFGTVREAVVSPDGRFVAYLAGPSLYVARADSGETKVLAANAEMRDLAWIGQDSAITYRRSDTVYAIARTGGAERRLQDGVTDAYAIARDGNAIAWGSTVNGASTLRLRSLVSDTSRVLTLSTRDSTIHASPPAQALQWSPDGRWLAAVTLGRILIISAHGSEAGVIRPSSTMLPNRDLPFLPFARWLSWGATSDTLYFDRWHSASVPNRPGAVGRASGDGTLPRRELLDALEQKVSARATRTRPVTLEGPVNVGAIGVIGAVARRWNGRWGQPFPVDTPANYGASAFSADGRAFAFIDSKDQYRLDRYNLKAMGPVAQRLAARGVASDRFYDFSPDGKLGAFARRVGATTDLYEVSSDGAQLRRLTELNARSLHSVRWSPDGSRIAFISDGDSTSTIGVLDLITGETRQFPTKLPLTARDLWTVVGTGGLVWSPDGKRVYFGTAPFIGGRMRRVGGIGTMDLQTGRDSTIENDGGPSPVISPSGTEVGFQDATGTRFVRVDLRSGRHDTTDMPFKAALVRWARDGSLLMTNADSAGTELWRVRLSGRRAERLGEIPAVCHMLAVSMDEHAAVCEELELDREAWIAERSDRPKISHLMLRRVAP